MKRHLAALAAAALLAGCATYQPVPEGYAGPVAIVSDSSQSESNSKAQLFAMTEIDGNRIMNGFWASANASQGRGFALTVVNTERSVPAKAARVTLRGSHTTAAPIQAMASQVAGTFFSVEGVVNFEPRPDGKYVVKGELKKGASSVWIEDAATGQPVTEKVIER